MTTPQRILIIDDEVLNLRIIEEDLADKGYETITAQNGLEAWEFLQKDSNIDVILLDRMMPVMDGMQLLVKIKSDPTLKHIPVIMQTAASAVSEIQEGIKAGVFYYLTKPFEEETLVAIVNSALADAKRIRGLINELHQHKETIGLMEYAKFHFKTLDQAQNLSYLLACGFPDPDKAVVGISELMINAIEHGNLGITFSEKSQFLIKGTLSEEIEKRSRDTLLSLRRATIIFEKQSSKILLTILDEGKGFDWQSFLHISSEQVVAPNGRGIAMAKMFSFDAIEYYEPGNKVVASVNL